MKCDGCKFSCWCELADLIDSDEFDAWLQNRRIRRFRERERQMPLRGEKDA